MKIQGLAVLAMIIIIPMSIILHVYSSYQIKTLKNQIEYDARLNSATYDAIKAFQTNMSNSSSSMVMDSKIRDLSAAVNIFYSSLASHFDMAGYGEDLLRNYVPAIVFTLYDGYYIYSAYENTLDEKDAPIINNNPDSTYKDGEELYGLKPYIYYSCRYIYNGSDIVITYSLDNYITVQGRVNGTNGVEYVNKSGYVLKDTDITGSGDNIRYKGFKILEESNKEGLKQNVFVPVAVTKGDGKPDIESFATLEGVSPTVAENGGAIIKCQFNKVNGTKYYIYGDDIFSIINDKLNKQLNPDDERAIQKEAIETNKNGLVFYQKAQEFTKWVNDNLSWVRPRYAVKENGESYGPKYSEIDPTPYDDLDKIFGYGIDVEDEKSNFNAHKMQVIKNSIETNLALAINKYNLVSSSSLKFAMPRLQDHEWESISKGVSMITFLQGLSIGGKIYNGHSIVQNTLTEDYVSKDSIYIVAGDGMYYRVTDPDLLNKNLTNACRTSKYGF